MMTEEKAELIKQASKILSEVFPDRHIDIHIGLSEIEMDDMNLFIKNHKLSSTSENINSNIILHIEHKRELDGK